ncbi:hypothetical protein Ct61P_15561 [Colletotrichum tofieldiae]|nr:hypothetical protein Ct61P_15561 [Colletotrichum tofieldiae]
MNQNFGDFDRFNSNTRRKTLFDETFQLPGWHVFARIGFMGSDAFLAGCFEIRLDGARFNYTEVD